MNSQKMEVELKIKVSNKYGLHARASTALVQTAAQFDSAVHLGREGGEEFVDAKSILGIMSMGAECGADLCLKVDGIDAEEAVEAIVALFERKFDEE
tara:strand:- start:2331 stop:2621 length:291 start_codon:yes stop_codon:yes gene_type:complete